MKEFLWWVFMTLIGVGVGYYIAGLQGSLFLAFVCVIGGAFLIFERKTHQQG